MNRAEKILKELSELEPRYFDPSVKLPVHLNMAFTYRCKAACPHCYFLQKDRDLFVKNRVDLEEEVFRKILKQPGSSKIRRMSCGGGEALLHNDIFSFLDIALDNGIEWIQLITNGMSLLENSVFKRLKEHMDKYHNLLVSLDAADESDYAAAKGLKKADFSEICRRIKELIDSRVEKKSPVIGAGFVIGSHNVKNVKEMIALSEKLGFDFCHFTTLHITDDSEEYQSTIDQVPEQYRNIINRSDYNINIIMQMPVNSGFSDFYCSSLANHLSISSDGKLAPCCHIPWSSKYGNTDDLKDSPFHQSEIVKIRQKFSKAQDEGSVKELHSACAKCNRRLKGLVKFDKKQS